MEFVVAVIIGINNFLRRAACPRPRDWQPSPARLPRTLSTAQFFPVAFIALSGRLEAVAGNFIESFEPTFIVRNAAPKAWRSFFRFGHRPRQF